MEKITRKTNIAKLISEYPDTADVLLAFGLHCVGCFASQFDTIEEGAKVHQMLDEEIDEMIDELNAVVGKEKDGVGEIIENETDEYKSSSKSKLKVRVDQDTCIGCGTCVVVAPKTFEMGDEYKSVVMEDFSDSDEVIKDAESSCPVDAIKVKDK